MDNVLALSAECHENGLLRAMEARWRNLDRIHAPFVFGEVFPIGVIPAFYPMAFSDNGD